MELFLKILVWSGSLIGTFISYMAWPPFADRPERDIDGGLHEPRTPCSPLGWWGL